MKLSALHWRAVRPATEELLIAVPHMEFRGQPNGFVLRKNLSKKQHVGPSACVAVPAVQCIC